MASLVLLAKRMPNELRSSKKPGTKLREARRGLIPNFLSHKHGCQHLSTMGSLCEMMHI